MPDNPGDNSLNINNINNINNVGGLKPELGDFLEKTKVTLTKQQKMRLNSVTTEELNIALPGRLEKNAAVNAVPVGCASVAKGKYLLCTYQYQEQDLGTFQVLMDRNGALIDPLKTDYGKLRAWMDGPDTAWMADMFSESDLADVMDLVGRLNLSKSDAMLKPYLLSMLPRALQETRQMRQKGKLDAETWMQALHLDRIDPGDRAAYLEGKTGFEKLQRALCVKCYADCYNDKKKAGASFTDAKGATVSRERFMAALLGPANSETKAKSKGKTDDVGRIFAKNLLGSYVLSFDPALPYDVNRLNFNFGLFPGKESYLNGCVLHDQKLETGSEIPDWSLENVVEGQNQRVNGMKFNFNGSNLATMGAEGADIKKQWKNVVVSRLKDEGFSNGQIYAAGTIPYHQLNNLVMQRGRSKLDGTDALDVRNLKVDVFRGDNGDMRVEYALDDIHAPGSDRKVSLKYGVVIRPDGSMTCDQLQIIGTEEGDEAGRPLAVNPTPAQLDVIFNRKLKFVEKADNSESDVVFGKLAPAPDGGAILCEMQRSGGLEPVQAAILPDGSLVTRADYDKGLRTTVEQHQAIAELDTGRLALLMRINDLRVGENLTLSQDRQPVRGNVIKCNVLRGDKVVGAVLVEPNGDVHRSFSNGLLSLEDEKILKDVARMSYGSGFFEKEGGGGGHIGLVTAADGSPHVVKFNTHKAEQGGPITKAELDASNALRDRLLQIAQRTGNPALLNDIRRIFDVPADARDLRSQTALSTRKQTAKLIATFEGMFGRDAIWDQAKYGEDMGGLKSSGSTKLVDQFGRHPELLMNGSQLDAFDELKAKSPDLKAIGTAADGKSVICRGTGLAGAQPTGEILITPYGEVVTVSEYEESLANLDPDRLPLITPYDQRGLLRSLDPFTLVQLNALVSQIVAENPNDANRCVELFSCLTNKIPQAMAKVRSHKGFGTDRQENLNELLKCLDLKDVDPELESLDPSEKKVSRALINLITDDIYEAVKSQYPDDEDLRDDIQKYLLPENHAESIRVYEKRKKAKDLNFAPLMDNCMKVLKSVCGLHYDSLLKCIQDQTFVPKTSDFFWKPADVSVPATKITHKKIEASGPEGESYECLRGVYDQMHLYLGSNMRYQNFRFTLDGHDIGLNGTRASCAQRFEQNLKAEGHGYSDAQIVMAVSYLNDDYFGFAPNTFVVKSPHNCHVSVSRFEADGEFLPSDMKLRIEFPTEGGAVVHEIAVHEDGSYRMVSHGKVEG